MTTLTNINKGIKKNKRSSIDPCFVESYNFQQNKGTLVLLKVN
jgi:hypothetical protein